MKHVFLGVFVLAAAVHLWASRRENRRVRNISKPFLLPSLLGFYVLGARSPAAAIILALVFSWLGDVLLIPRGVRWFTAGGIAFMVSHAFFILGYSRDVDFARIPAALIAGLALLFLAAAVWVFRRLRPHLPRALFYPMFFYLLLNGAMNCFSIFRCITVPSAAAVTTAVGAVLFFVSDCTLFFVRFHKESRWKTHFPVMLTYLLGELLIVLGLL